MPEYDILLFDIKGYSKDSTNRQLEIKENLKDCIEKYFKSRSRNFFSLSTGDGYYICLENDHKNLVVFLDLIAAMMTELEEIQIRYALHTGILRSFQDLNNHSTITGVPLSELNRFLAEVKSGDVIFCSRAFYEKFINGTFIAVKSLGDRKLFTYKKIVITDKHNKPHEVYNLSFSKDSVEYGFELNEAQLDLNNNDNIEFDDFRRVVEYSFGHRNTIILSQHTQSKPAIHYCYLVVDISQFSKEYFLFIKNDSNKIQTIDHIERNIKPLSEPLTICVNNKYLEGKRDEFWKNDFLQKFKEKLPLIKKYSFFYLSDFIWKNCIPEALKKPNLFNEEKNYINPEYQLEGQTAIKKVPVDEYLLRFITADATPICLLKGSGGMGKTTLLKRISDLLSKQKSNQKFVFFIDGQIFAKKYRNEDLQLQRIETLPDLLKFYFSTLTQSATFLTEAPILLDDELVNIVVSSGNVVLIIDGLDEISGFLKSNFDLNTFITDVVNINKLLNHSKIVIATRDYYWDNEFSKIDKGLIESFRIVDLKGFNEAMASQYFEKKFQKDNEKIKKAILMLKSLTKQNNTFYWPFLVYLVSDIVLKEEDVVKEIELKFSDLQSRYLSTEIEFDNIIINFCLRENKRQNLELDVDDFMDLFKEIVIEYQGEMRLVDFQEYVHTIFPSILSSDGEEAGFKRLLVNPLLREKREKVTMSVDFIQYHLNSVFLAYFIANGIQSTNIYRLLARYYDGEDEILKDISARLNRWKVDIKAFQEFLKKIVVNLKRVDINLTEKHLLQKSVSTILYLAFKVFEPRVSKGMKERTSLLLELYVENLDNVHIYGQFYRLDFSSLIIRNSSFNYYSNLLKSQRDIKTRLIDTKVIIASSETRIGAHSWDESNFDISCTLNAEFKAVLRNTGSSNSGDLYAIKKDIIALALKFQKSGKFIPRKEADLDFLTSSKLSSAHLVREMVENGVVGKFSNRQKYNWNVLEGAKDSVNQLLHNDHVDAFFERVINIIYKRYYK